MADQFLVGLPVVELERICLCLPIAADYTHIEPSSRVLRVTNCTVSIQVFAINWSVLQLTAGEPLRFSPVLFEIAPSATAAVPNDLGKKARITCAWRLRLNIGNRL